MPAEQRGWLLLGLGFATGMEFYTYDSVNLVLPDLTGTLGISADEASWLLTVYSSALLIGVPISVWLAGHFGHKRFLIATVIAYAAASIGCAAAADLSTMLVWRAVQGFAGAGLVVWWRGSIYLLLPKPQRSPALMRVSTMLYLSSAAGLLVSGYLTDHASWRLIFLPNLATAAAALVLLIRWFPTSPPPQDARSSATDWLGMVLIAIALISLQIILSRGELDDWLEAPQLRALAFASTAALVLFVLWQYSAANRTPLLRLDLLADRNVVSSVLIGVPAGMILSGSLYVLPEFLRNIATPTLSATQTGTVMCVYALTAAAIRPMMVGLIARIGQRKAICLALIMLIASMLVLERYLTAQTPTRDYLVPLVLYAFCLAPLLPSVGSGTVGRVGQKDLLDGVALYMTCRQFGASLGVALISVLLDRRETQHAARLLDHVRATNPTTQSWLAAAAHVVATHQHVSGWQQQRVADALLAAAASRQAATLAYADAFLLMAFVGAVAFCCIPVIPPAVVAPKV